MPLNNLHFSDVGLYVLGFVAQGMFGARSIVQWVQSERAGKVVSPAWFWIFSLSGSFLFLIYGLFRTDVVIMVGQTLSFYIYIRNLQLKAVWQNIPIVFRRIILIWPLVLFSSWFYFFPEDGSTIFSLRVFTDLFLIIGGIGQLLLNLRYVYQWYQSEKVNESVLPLGFWLISLLASVMVVLYGWYRHDPVLLVAQGLGIIIYVRNIYFALKNNRSAQ